MNIEKLKDECRWCAKWDWVLEWCNEICKYNGLQHTDTPSKWQLHPDLAEDTTELTEVSFRNVRLNKMVTAYFETACCKVSPITDENYCPNCGKKIV